jgi:hypothetical protein
LVKAPGHVIDGGESRCDAAVHWGKGKVEVRMPVLQVTERVEGHRGTQDALPGKADRRSSNPDVLERGPEEEHGYTWLEDYIERLEGKETRREYYTRLERAASI